MLDGKVSDVYEKAKVGQVSHFFLGHKLHPSSDCKGFDGWKLEGSILAATEAHLFIFSVKVQHDVYTKKGQNKGEKK